MTPRELVEQHLPLVRAIAYRLKKTTLTGAAMEDLEAAGNLGLVEAAARFREGTGATFATYAFTRIQGAMMDGARRELGGGKAHALLQRVDFDEVPEAVSEAPDVEGDMDLRGAVAALPERERALLVAVDVEGGRLEDAGEALGITKSWASRLRARAVETVRAACASRPRVRVARPVAVQRDVKPEKVVQVAAPVSVVQPRRQSVVFRGRTPFRAPFNVSRGSGSGCRGDGGTPVRPPGRGSDASAASPPTMDRRPRWERQSAGPCDLGSLIHRHERGIERAGAPPGTAAGAWAS